MKMFLVTCVTAPIRKYPNCWENGPISLTTNFFFIILRNTQTRNHEKRMVFSNHNAAVKLCVIMGRYRAAFSRAPRLPFALARFLNFCNLLLIYHPTCTWGRIKDFTFS